MPFQINWLQALIFFALGWLLGQRYSHMHPLVKNTTG